MRRKSHVTLLRHVSTVGTAENKEMIHNTLYDFLRLL